MPFLVCLAEHVGFVFLLIRYTTSWGFPGGSVVENPLPASAGGQEMWVQPLGLEDPLEKGNATHSSILA